MVEMNLVQKENETIFFVINTAYGGGAERVIANLTKSLENRYNVYLILLYKQTSEDYDTGGTIIVLDDGKKRNWVSKMFFFKKRLEQLTFEYKPKLIVSFLLNASLCNILARTRVKKIVSIRNYLKNQLRGKKLKFWEFCFKYLFSRADLVVTVSKNMEQDMVENYNLNPEKSKVIYNPYNIENLLAASQESLDDKYSNIFKDRVIINLGHLGIQKGQYHLIRAFAELKKTVKDVRLVIIGKDNKELETERKLKELAKELGVLQDVFFLGYQKNPHKYLARSTVFVFPSLYEGFPNALVEAMICGLPVISSDCNTGPREILAPDTHFTKKSNSVEECKYGYLIPEDTTHWLGADVPITYQEECLVNALKNILENKEKHEHFSKMSKERGNSFSVETATKEWMNIF
jgi:glycosyltransferase involved in cell wall biosynthesis